MATRNVAVLLGDPRKFDPVKPNQGFDEDDFDTINQLKDALYELRGYNFTYLNNHDTLIDDLRKIKNEIDYVFNLCDEGFYNDPKKELHIVALLEILGISYTGAGPQCMVYCYDKAFVTMVARNANVPVPSEMFIEGNNDVPQDIPIEFPLIVKPNFSDGGFGITQKSVVNTQPQLREAVMHLRKDFNYKNSILIEKYLAGGELTAGIIGNPPQSYQVLPFIEEDFSILPEGLPHICGYEAKWYPDSPYWKLTSRLARIPTHVENLIKESCVKLFERLECHDYCRFDWRLDLDGNPYLLEVNPNPGWCWDGHLAKMSKYSGLSYSNMLEAILHAAEQRLGI
jgi:D-alanine-D-alanine ligase